MKLATALLISVGALSLLVALIAVLRRRFFLVRQLSFPLYVGAAVAALEVFRLFGPGDPRWQLTLTRALGWALLFFGFATVLRLLGLFLFDIHWSGRKGLRLPPLLPAVAMALIYLITAFVTLKLTFPEFDIGPLLATSAVTSLVLGLALQPILGNFFAGLVLSVEKPFRLNDWIRVGEHEGRVVDITWRTTHLRTRDNDNLVFPNGKLADERIVNYYYPHSLHMEHIKVGVEMEAPPYRVRRALLEAIVGVPGALDKPSPEVYLLSFEASSVLYELRVWIDDMAHSTRIASDLRIRIWEEMQKAGISIPYPLQHVEIVRRKPERLEGRTAGPPPARLYVNEGTERGRSFDLLLPSGEPVMVGRSRHCTVPLSDPNSSKEHLRIERTDEGYVLTDLGSSFGTRVNGQPVTRTVLKPFDRIAIGDTVMIFESDAHRD